MKPQRVNRLVFWLGIKVCALPCWLPALGAGEAAFLLLLLLSVRLQLISQTDEQKVKKKRKKIRQTLRLEAAGAVRVFGSPGWVGSRAPTKAPAGTKERTFSTFQKPPAFCWQKNKTMLAKIRFSNPDRRFDVKSIQSLFFTKKNQRLGLCRMSL